MIIKYVSILVIGTIIFKKHLSQISQLFRQNPAFYYSKFQSRGLKSGKCLKILMSVIIIKLKIIVICVSLLWNDDIK